MSQPRVAKSILYTSAIRPSSFNKLFNSNAHVGVIDLEDGVPEQLKMKAHENLLAFSRTNITSSSTKFALRINELSRIHGLNDLRFFVEHNIFPEIFIMSMVHSICDIDYLKRFLEKLELSALPKIYVTVESPKAIDNLKDIASQADALIFGSADYCAAMGIKIGGWEKLLYARSKIVNTAAHFSIPAYDTAYFILEDEQGLQDESNKAKELGFMGKTAVHPQQIATINNIFTPTESEICEAKMLIDSLSQAEASIIRRNKEMLGPPFYRLAANILERC